MLRRTSDPGDPAVEETTMPVAPVVACVTVSRTGGLPVRFPATVGGELPATTTVLSWVAVSTKTVVLLLPVQTPVAVGVPVTLLRTSVEAVDETNMPVAPPT